MTTILVSIVLLIVDLLYAAVDPRIKAQYVTSKRRKRMAKSNERHFQKARSQLSEVMHQFRKNKGAMLGGAVVLIIIFIAVLQISGL